MTLKLDAMKTGSKAERIPEGTYMGRFVSLMDLGIQPQTDWQTGEPTAPKPRVLITWELPDVTITLTDDDGNETEKPRWISKEYTASNYEQANLMKLIKPFGISGGELDVLLGQPCMVTVGSTVNGKAKVTAVIPAPKGMPVPDLNSDPVSFDFDALDEEIFSIQPDWLKERIKEAVNYTGFADSWGAQESA